MLLFSKDKKDDLKDELHLDGEIVVDIVKDQYVSESPKTPETAVNGTIIKPEELNEHLSLSSIIENKPTIVEKSENTVILHATEMRKIADNYFFGKPSLEWLEHVKSKTEFIDTIYALIEDTAKDGYYKLEIGVGVCKEFISAINKCVEERVKEGSASDMLTRFIYKIKPTLFEIHTVFRELGYDVDIKFIAATIDRKYLECDDLPIERIEIRSEKPINLENRVIEGLEVVFNLQW